MTDLAAAAARYMAVTERLVADDKPWSAANAIEWRSAHDQLNVALGDQEAQGEA